MADDRDEQRRRQEQDRKIEEVYRNAGEEVHNAVDRAKGRLTEAKGVPGNSMLRPDKSDNDTARRERSLITEQQQKEGEETRQHRDSYGDRAGARGKTIGQSHREQQHHETNRPARERADREEAGQGTRRDQDRFAHVMEQRPDAAQGLARNGVTHEPNAKEPSPGNQYRLPSGPPRGRTPDRDRER